MKKFAIVFFGICVTAVLQAQTQVLFLGGFWDLDLQHRIAQRLGPGFKVTFETKQFRSKAKRADIIILDLGPQVITMPDMGRLEGFVPEGRAEIRTLKKRFRPKKILVPLHHMDDDEFNVYESLTKQIVREEDVEALDLGDIQNYASGQSVVDKIFITLAESQRNPGTWHLISATSEQSDEGPAKNAIDNNPDTYWHTRYDPNPTKVPHEIIIDLGNPQTLAGFSYLSRQDGGVNGRVKDFEIYLSDDPNKWAAPVMKGTFQNTMSEQRLLFDEPQTGRYLKFVALSEVNGNIWTSMAELGILPTGKSK